MRFQECNQKLTFLGTFLEQKGVNGAICIFSFPEQELKTKQRNDKTILLETNFALTYCSNKYDSAYTPLFQTTLQDFSI